MAHHDTTTEVYTGKKWMNRDDLQHKVALQWSKESKLSKRSLCKKLHRELPKYTPNTFEYFRNVYDITIDEEKATAYFTTWKQPRQEIDLPTYWHKRLVKQES